MTTDNPNEIERRIIGAKDAIDRQMDEVEDALAVHVANRVEDLPLKVTAKAEKLLADSQETYSFIRPGLIDGQVVRGEIEGGE